MARGCSSKDVIAVLEYAKSLGWTISKTRNSHYQLRLKHKVIHTGSTPSDYRTAKNLRAQIKRETESVMPKASQETQAEKVIWKKKIIAFIDDNPAHVNDVLVADLAGVKTATVRKWRKMNAIPHSSISTLRTTYSLLVDEVKRKTQPEPPKEKMGIAAQPPKDVRKKNVFMMYSEINPRALSDDQLDSLMRMCMTEISQRLKHGS